MLTKTLFLGVFVRSLVCVRGLCFFAGGAVTCTSVHVGEIRPGTFRGNHRHYTSNETFVIWGAQTKFRVSSCFNIREKLS